MGSAVSKGSRLSNAGGSDGSPSYDAANGFTFVCEIEQPMRFFEGLARLYRDGPGNACDFKLGLEVGEQEIATDLRHAIVDPFVLRWGVMPEMMMSIYCRRPWRSHCRMRTLSEMPKFSESSEWKIADLMKLSFFCREFFGGLCGVRARGTDSSRNLCVSHGRSNCWRRPQTIFDFQNGRPW